MLFSIKHRTGLKYSETTLESVMEMRVHPRVDERQVVRQFDVSVSPEARVVYHVDWLGNTVHQFSLLRSHDEVSIVSRALVETRPTGVELDKLMAPLQGLTNDHRWRDFLGFDGPVQPDQRLSQFADSIGLRDVKRVGDAIRLVTDRIRELVQYRRGVTTTTSTVCDVLDAKVGVCQDFAHLGLSALRGLGVPCRYVSGYLFQENESELESHAWCEAYVPGVGWVGLDPTHANLVDENYVSVAAGRNYADVPPHRGVFRGAAHQALAASVLMDRVGQGARQAPFAPLEPTIELTPPARAIGLQRAGYHQEHQPVDPASFSTRLTQQRQQQQQ